MYPPTKYAEISGVDFTTIDNANANQRTVKIKDQLAAANGRR